MTGISMVVPCEQNRLPLFEKTLEAYKAFGIPSDFEIVLVSRTLRELPFAFPCPVQLITYKFQGPFFKGVEVFNPSKALNLGVKYAKYRNVIITSPEVRPVTNALQQFGVLDRGNYVAQLIDVGISGARLSIVNSNFRGDTPGFYFLSMYRKEDIEAINGWGNVYMQGHSWDDNSFGERFVRAGLKFKMMDDIVAEHQFHPKAFTDWNEYTDINKATLLKERALGIIQYSDGLNEVTCA